MKHKVLAFLIVVRDCGMWRSFIWHKHLPINCYKPITPLILNRGHNVVQYGLYYVNEMVRKQRCRYCFIEQGHQSMKCNWTISINTSYSGRWRNAGLIHFHGHRGTGYALHLAISASRILSLKTQGGFRMLKRLKRYFHIRRILIFEHALKNCPAKCMCSWTWYIMLGPLCIQRSQFDGVDFAGLKSQAQTLPPQNSLWETLSAHSLLLKAP